MHRECAFSHGLIHSFISGVGMYAGLGAVWYCDMGLLERLMPLTPPRDLAHGTDLSRNKGFMFKDAHRGDTGDRAWWWARDCDAKQRATLSPRHQPGELLQENASQVGPRCVPEPGRDDGGTSLDERDRWVVPVIICDLPTSSLFSTRT